MQNVSSVPVRISAAPANKPEQSGDFLVQLGHAAKDIAATFKPQGVKASENVPPSKLSYDYDKSLRDKQYTVFFQTGSDGAGAPTTLTVSHVQGHQPNIQIHAPDPRFVYNRNDIRYAPEHQAVYDFLANQFARSKKTGNYSADCGSGASLTEYGEIDLNRDCVPEKLTKHTVYGERTEISYDLSFGIPSPPFTREIDLFTLAGKEGQPVAQTPDRMRYTIDACGEIHVYKVLA